MRNYKLFFLVFFLSIFLTGCSTNNSFNNSTNLKTISLKEWKKIVDSNEEIIILDVRTPLEFKQFHIENSINIDFYNENFKTQISKLDKNKKYLIYCRSGVRSYKTLQLMKNLNFDYVLDLDGGISAWQSKNFPLKYN